MGNQQSGLQQTDTQAVTFSKDTESVEISDRYLVTFPLELRQLPNLKYLNLSRNKITRVDGVSGILNLEELDISYNALTILSDDLFLCNKLNKLNLSFNQISQIQSLIQQLKQIKQINLSNNIISQLPNEIGFLKNLTVLNISFNKLQNLPKTIGQLDNLTKLIANNNKLQLLPIEIGALSQLTLLDLAENELRILPTQVSQLGCLTKLYLDNNDFLEMIPEISKLTQLKELNLRSNQLVDLPSSYHKLVNLQILDLDDNQWDHIDYTVNDIKRLLDYLKTKKDIVNKSRKSTSKEYRRTITRQKLEDKKRLSLNNLFENNFQVIEFKKKLLQLKGKSIVFVKKVPLLVDSLNTEDIFIFDIGKKIYIINGNPNLNQRERQKAVHLSKLMKEERGAADIILLDFKNSRKEEINEFWKDFGVTGRVNLKNKSSNNDDDDIVQEEHILETKLFKFFEPEEGRLDIQVYAAQILYRNMLDSNSCSILDTGTDIYVWSGLYSSANEKSWSMLKAEELISRRSDNAEIHWLIEGMETLLFIEYFVDWVDNSWDQEYIKTQNQIKEREEQEKLEAERERRRMEKEEEEEMEKMKRRSFEQQQLQQQQQQQQEFEQQIKQQKQQTLEQQKQELSFAASTSINNSPYTFTPIISPTQTTTANNNFIKPLPSIVNLPSIPSSNYNNNNNNLSEREKIKEREKEKIRERLKQRESGASTSQTNLLQPQKISPEASPILPSIPKSIPSIQLEKESSVILPSITKPLPKEPDVVTLPQTKQPSPVITPSQPTKQPSPVLSPVKPLPKEPTVVALPKVEPVKPLPKEPTNAVPLPKVEPAKPLPKEPTVVALPKVEPVSIKKETITPTVTVNEQSIFDDKNGSQTLAPLPEKAETAKRQAASRNPIRARQERAALEEAEAKKRLAEQEQMKLNNTLSVPANTSTNKASSVASALGGFGLLYSVGADETMFKKRAERAAAAAVNPEPFSINIQPKDQPKLLHVKGRRSPFVRQVELSYQSLNKGDVFILDCGKEKNLLYQWNGSEANRIEKGKGMDIGKSIKDKERVGCRVVIIDEGKEPEDFWKVLGGKGEIASADTAGDDREAELNIRKYINLFRAQPINGDKELDLVPLDGRLSKTLLEGGECYILDCISEMFVWTGSNSKLKVRNMTLKLANDMFASRSANCWTSGAVHREFPGSEQVLFKERFSDWGGSLPIAMQQAPVGVNTASAKKQEKIDVATMHKPKPEKEEVMIDDGSGKLTIWRVEEFQKVAIDPKNYGQFYSGDSYLILYTYFFKNKDNYLIYFWQGKNSSINEKGTSALLTVELDDQLKGMAKEVRVVQNKEPKHFLTIFKGRFIIHQGKDPLSKNYKPQANIKDPRLYHVRGTTDFNTRVIQSKLSTLTLNSYNSFILNNQINNGTIYIWYGKLSNSIERALAKKIVQSTSPNQNDGAGCKVVEFEENKESEEFFKLLGGRSNYPLSKITSRVEPRLYLCTVGTGVFVVEEVNSFAQDDLLQEDVFIVDGIDNIFVWIGTETTEVERKSSMEVAMEYSATLPAPRKQNVPVYLTYHGKEPFIFTSLFHGWDFSKRILPTFSYDGELTLAKDVLNLYTKKYTYEEIVNKKYPKGIDGSRLEEYLEEDDFKKIFQGLTLEEFQKLPLWKKQTWKKELRLY
ncbi:hypothetical protein DICPUDRAFT_51061 [Dictyostelium purpureum]|uniref:HP domain-containing protein n=1 Tax=Dictyostelium purpureum TaxID=5786 RepID=F1A1R9_DICPU|nr:uncharacterized protein DICPUDRAFT_51061 [Dictyostelium purpureum]EGC29857.1 hypothetical protein DICPUDRAFT_51061 [Dictyostelium purpureum]|eukprot:XP_003293612.1 hypothetical protein DICPUDRAFT_51061 [Dictyostelium purpureum]